MANWVILVVSMAVLLVAAVSGRLSRAWLTEPLAMVAIGMVAAAAGLGPFEVHHPIVLVFFELTLALVLFSDAARIDLRRRGRAISWPARMLIIGLPLAILLGSMSAIWILGVPFGLALLVGSVLAPTDAALAEPVIEAKSLPVRVRQALNAEAGLNDGLALPAVFIAVGIIEAEESGLREGIFLMISQIGIGLVGGVLTGFFGAWLIGNAIRNDWMNPLHQRIAALALALVCFAAVQLLGGSGFVGTFIAGTVLGHRVRPRCDYLYEFAETEGKMMVLVAFLLLGAGPMYVTLQNGIPIEAWLIAILSLFVVRPAAIAISLIRGRLLPATMAFLGWFGPRGLATAVFYLLAVEELGMTADERLGLHVVVAVMLLSILLHGLSAKPASDWLGRRIEREERVEMAEMAEVEIQPTRSFSKQTPR